MLLPGAIAASRYVPRQAGSAHDLLHKLLAVLGRPWQPDQLMPRPALVSWEEDADFW